MERFATPTERIRILQGLLSYRAALEARGISSGFQGLDGSFLEHKEAIQAAAPNDVDVVTFFPLPPSVDQAGFADLFDPAQTKVTFHGDAYPFVLGRSLGAAEVRRISYWHSMWSHRRNGLWKGFVQVDISPEEDQIAEALLSQIEQEAAAR